MVQGQVRLLPLFLNLIHNTMQTPTKQQQVFLLLALYVVVMTIVISITPNV